MGHVVILDENLPVPLDRRVWLEARALTAVGYKVSIISPRGTGDMAKSVERRDGILILRYPQRAASGLAGYLIEYVPSIAASMLLLLALRMRGPVDVIHGCNPPDLFYLLGRIGRLWGAKYVFDQHDANPELARTKWGDRRLGKALLRLTTALERESYRAADLVIVTNDSYAQLARDRGQVDEERLIVVRNAPPRGAFGHLARQGSAGADRSSGYWAGAGTRPFRLGYLGVMGSQDGVEILIDAIAILARDRPDLDVHAELVGDGEARPGLEARVAAGGLDDRITFHGYQGPDVFVPLLARSDLCVSPDPPTPFNDVSTMTKVVEYLAIGCPVVAFDLAETRRIIGPAGLIATGATAWNLAARIAALADDDEGLRRMAEAARDRLDALDLAWEVSAARLVEGYDRLMRQR